MEAPACLASLYPHPKLDRGSGRLKVSYSPSTEGPLLNVNFLLPHGRNGARIPFFLGRAGAAMETEAGEVTGSPGSCALLDDTVG